MYIYPYNKVWKIHYKQEVEQIRSYYKGSITLYHIGSTAIDGLDAKDCIDILGVVENTVDLVAQKQDFIRAGYIYKGDHGLLGREYFSKVKRKVHLHIYPLGHVAIKQHLNFIDVMQGNDRLIDELNQIKQYLHSKYPNDKSAYQREKSYFYNNIQNSI